MVADDVVVDVADLCAQSLASTGNCFFKMLNLAARRGWRQLADAAQ